MELTKQAEEAGLLAPEWRSVATVQLVALATILCGRFLELAYLALASNGCKDKEIWANLSGPRPPRKNDQELAEAIRRSARPAELVRELDENRRRNDRLLRELIVRAALQNRPMLDMLIFAESRSPKIDPVMAMDMVTTGLGIKRLDEDAKQIAIVGAVAAFHRESKAALEATLANLRPGLVPPAVTRIVPQAETPATRAKLYRYAYVLVSKLDLIFASDPWLLPDAARQAWRNEHELQEAQKRGGYGAHKTAEARRAGKPERAIEEVSWDDHHPGDPGGHTPNSNVTFSTST